MNKFEYRKKLNQLVKEKKYPEAFETLKDIDLSSEWCHLAVTVYTFSEKKVLAEQAIVWAKKNADLIVWRRCIYEYVKALWEKNWGFSPEGNIILPLIITEEKRSEINKILEIINPVLLHIQGDKLVSTELESKMLLIAINSFWLLGDIKKVKELSPLLLHKKPASIELANLALFGIVDKESLTNNFPEELIRDYPESFNAFMLSHLLKTNIFGQGNKAFESLKSSAPNIKSENKLRYLEGLFQIAQSLGEPEIKESIKIIEELVGKEDTFYKLVKAEYLLNSGKEIDAEKIVEECKDEKNPQWLQLYAFIQAQKEDYVEAVKYYEKAAEINSCPDVLTTLGRLAIQASEKDIKFLNNVISAYSALLKLNPDNLSARHSLAFALSRQGRVNEAKDHFKYLSEKSSNIIYKENYGKSLAYIGENEQALVAYDEICKMDDALVEAILVKTDLLRHVKNQFIAFDFLRQYRKRFWKDPLYLQFYMKAASQANHDTLMNEALHQLRKLQLQGKASPDIIQEKSLDDLLKHVESSNERNRRIQKMYLRGEITWICSDDILNRPCYDGWLIRTQEAGWISEEPTLTASSSVYSTNGFHPLKSEDDKKMLQRLETPLPNSEVVLDITALMTLHRLGLLDKINSFFKTIFIPTVYLSKLSVDYDNLLPHQYSNYEAICEIKKSIDDGLVKILNDVGEPRKRPLPYINEHTFPEKDVEHHYRFVDLINVLKECGLIRQEELDNINKIILNPSGVDGQHISLQKNDDLLIELSTLITACNYNVYEKIINCFKVSISEEDKNQIISTCNYFANQEDLQKWNNDLKSILLTNAFEKCDVTIDEKENDLSFAAFKLSNQKNLPLCADDRAIQACGLNDKPQNSVYGTDLLLNSFYSQSFVDIEKLTNAYLQLINWRYKFIIPPLEVLTYLAGQYANNPPGNELNKIATYAQGCMRDPGLFGSPEKTEPPLSMSIKLYLEWSRLVVNFIVKCWTSKDFDQEIAKVFIDWALLNFLPTHPANMPTGENRLTALTKKMVFDNVSVQLLTFDSVEDGNKLFLFLKQKLGLNDLEYNRMIAEVLDAL
jgi:tetratricopeptide (TPR) repeat protein